MDCRRSAISARIRGDRLRPKYSNPSSSTFVHNLQVGRYAKTIDLSAAYRCWLLFGEGLSLQLVQSLFIDNEATNDKLPAYLFKKVVAKLHCRCDDMPDELKALSCCNQYLSANSLDAEVTEFSPGHATDRH